MISLIITLFLYWGCSENADSGKQANDLAGLEPITEIEEEDVVWTYDDDQSYWVRRRVKGRRMRRGPPKGIGKAEEEKDKQLPTSRTRRRTRKERTTSRRLLWRRRME